MSLTEIIFLLVALATLVGAVGLALTRQLIRAAFWLFLVLFGTGALYVFVGADVLAVSQIVVYVGGILILIVFGVMLTHKGTGTAPATRITQVIPALAIVLALGVGIFSLVRQFPVSNISWEAKPEVALPNVEAIGLQTMTHWLVPFEAVSLLLLIALVGAAYLARPDEKKK
ncbi:MAG: NADH-quinone oxidoreductase subunit J [Bacteroidia bacterium]|nr:NADH-quinone oxidoreductase subunit J [Bacteroidia bacterium]